MKQFVLLLLVFAVMACSHTPSPAHKCIYGDPGPDTIAVTVGRGFLFRGIYHLPAGSKVGLLLDTARVLPSAKELRHGVVDQSVPCSVQSASKNDKASAGFDEVNKPTFRNFVLRDGDKLAFVVYNF